MNVIAPRWSGMGSTPNDLSFTKRDEWYKDMRDSKELALRYGDKIIIGGMSLGGTLVAHDLIVNKGKDIAGVILMSPAIGVAPKITKACWFTGLYGAKKEYGTDVRYPKISYNGTCQLIKVVRDILKSKLGKRYKPKNEGKFDNGLSLDLNKLYEDIDMPIFNVITGYDSAIDFELSIGISTHSKSNELGKSTLVYYYNPADEQIFPPHSASDMITVKAEENISHASTLLRNDRLLSEPEFNPFYNQLEEDLSRFIDQNFQ